MTKMKSLICYSICKINVSRASLIKNLDVFELYDFIFGYRYILDSIVVSIPACHAGDRGSIPRRGGKIFVLILLFFLKMNSKLKIEMFVTFK
jgi:hypothetical protein